MKIIKCKWFPPSGNKAIALLPFIIVRAKMFRSFTEYDCNHETIHLRQQFEMLLIGIILAIVLFAVGCGWWSLLALPVFFYWYGIEFVIRWFCYKFDWDKAYRKVAFEAEAYGNQQDLTYLSERKLLAWVEYL